MQTIDHLPRHESSQGSAVDGLFTTQYREMGTGTCSDTGAAHPELADLGIFQIAVAKNTVELGPAYPQQLSRAKLVALNARQNA